MIKRVPLLLIPKRVPVDRVIEIEARPIGFEGIVTVELGRNLRAQDRNPIILRRLQMKNLIVDAGLNELGGASTIPQVTNHCGVGTDSTAPTAGDTGLGAEILPRTTNNGGFADVYGFGPSFEYSFVQKTRLFLEGEANGNLTEVGLFRNSTSTPMWMRQLFKDGGGTPTTIVKTASDQLRITYELRAYPPSVDVPGTVNISGTDYDYVHRAANIDDPIAWGFGSGAFATGVSNFPIWSVGVNQATGFETQTLGSTQGQPAGTSDPVSSIAYSTYVAGNFFRDATHIWEPGDGNFALGFGSFLFSINGASTGHMFQTSFAATVGGARIDKDNTKRLTLVTRVSWANH